MFEQPAKKDVDYALSMLMHEARRQTIDEKNRITSEATKACRRLCSSRVILAVAAEANKVHEASLIRAKQTLIDFVQRMDKPATEITAWARPHLENLSNAVLGVVPPNGFPDDHQPIIRRYQAAFQRRIDGALREVEIGYVKGTGFSGDVAMSEIEEWINARDALSLLGNNKTYGRGKTICKRAHAGLIKARAMRFIRDGLAADNTDVPVEFWWAEGEKALSQNWETGDFETWINHTVRLQAFWVMFLRSDIKRSVPAPALEERQDKVTTNGKRIFVGHGRSPMWRELKDYLRDQLNWDVEEFNSIPTAGIATVDRLEEMLEVAAFAFLVMTAEDEQPDGKFNPRLNVIHEAGLFQGRLGFKKAIVLLEDGCEEFSNIHGLGQIRFPRGNISAKFHEIHGVLKREKLIT